MRINGLMFPNRRKETRRIGQQRFVKFMETRQQLQRSTITTTAGVQIRMQEVGAVEL